MSSNEPSELPPPPASWQPAPAPLPEPPRSVLGRQPRIIAGLVLALAIVIVVVATTPFWAFDVAPLLPWGPNRTQPVATDRDAGAIRDLQTRLDAAETILKDQGAQLAWLKTDAVALKDQAARLGRLEAGAETPVPARPTPTAATPIATPAPVVNSAPDQATEADVKALQDQFAKLDAAVAATGERIGKLETKVAGAGTAGNADRALLLALANLRVAIEGAGPYTAELAAVRSLPEATPAVKEALVPLGPDAKAGLPSLGTLAERFDRRVAPAILRARSVTTSDDWWAQIQSRLERLVVIRRIAPGGAAPSDATEAAVARAGATLKIGDLAGAVAALDKLRGASATAAAPWLADVRKRVAAEATLTQLWQRESARIAAEGHGAKP